MLGVDASSPRTDSQVVLHHGDTVWLFTDGLVERADQPLDQGLTRLRMALAATADEPLEDACDAMLERLLTGERPDDVAVIAVRALPQPAAEDPREPATTS